MFRRLARGGVALGIIAAMLGLLAPAASAQSAWSYYSYVTAANGTFGTATSSTYQAVATMNFAGTASVDYYIWGMQLTYPYTFDMSFYSGQNGTGTLVQQDTGLTMGYSSNSASDGSTHDTVHTASSFGSVVFESTTASGTAIFLLSFGPSASGACNSSNVPFTTACGGGSGALSSSVTFADPATVPAAPTGLTAAPGDASASLSWTASSGATSYTLLQSMSSGGTYSAVASGLAGTTYTVTGLTNGTTYYYEVEAVNSAGTSSPSSSASVTPSAAASPPAAPTGLTAAPGDGSASLSWTASSGASSYTVLQSTSSGGTYSAVASGLTGTTYTVTGLTNGTTYYYEVEAVNSAGTSAPSSSASVTPSAPASPPATPGGLTATGGSGQVSLSWSTVTGAVYYGILRGSGPGGPFALIASPAGTTYTDTGLQSTTTYYYEVEAVNSAGSSSPSAAVSATTLTATLVVASFQIPSLADAGLWGAIGALFGDMWPPIVLALALMLFAGLAGGFISVVTRGADRMRGL